MRAITGLLALIGTLFVPLAVILIIMSPLLALFSYGGSSLAIFSGILVIANIAMGLFIWACWVKFFFRKEFPGTLNLRFSEMLFKTKGKKECAFWYVSLAHHILWIPILISLNYLNPDSKFSVNITFQCGIFLWIALNIIIACYSLSKTKRNKQNKSAHTNPLPAE